MSDPVVVTIGYEGRSLDDLVDALHGADVELLVDVRLNAMSRKPGFSKRRLHEALSAAGIDYVHEPRLGNPQDNRAGFHAGEPSSLRRYDELMDTVGREPLAELRELVRERVVALMCYERDPAICHRTAIAGQLGAEVVEL